MFCYDEDSECDIFCLRGMAGTVLLHKKIEETCFGFGLTVLVVVCGRLHMLFKYNRFYGVPSVRYPRVLCWRFGKATCFTKLGTKRNGPKANITQTQAGLGRAFLGRGWKPT